VELLSGSAWELAGLCFTAEVRTQKIDAEGIATAEVTSFVSDKETGFRNFSAGGQLDPQQEVDQEQDRVIPILNALKATASRGALSTLRASLQDALLCHDFASAGNRSPVVF
jgi:hypothetical protein